MKIAIIKSKHEDEKEQATFLKYHLRANYNPLEKYWYVPFHEKDEIIDLLKNHKFRGLYLLESFLENENEVIEARNKYVSNKKG